MEDTITLDQGACLDQTCWKDMFYNLFQKDTELRLSLLKHCGTFSESDWKNNVKHALHQKINSECTIYGDVQELIRLSFSHKNPTLLISDLLLAKIPTNIGTLRHLSTLTLNELDIHDLPHEMKELTSLKTLTITKCPLLQVPDCVSNFSDLHTLNISRCRITTLPASLANCKNIDTLCLGLNDITSLPIPVLCMNVERLVLDSNPIDINWTEDMLPKCMLLSIAETGIKALPEHLVSRLYQLIWNSCGNIVLPSNFGTKLSHINLAGNNLDQIPDSIELLKDLKYLNLSNNRFIVKPDVLTRMNIEKFYFYNNPRQNVFQQ